MLTKIGIYPLAIGAALAVAVIGVMASPDGDDGGPLRRAQRPPGSPVADETSSGTPLDVAVFAAKSAPDEQEVLGDVIDCPPQGAGPEDVQSRFKLEGNEFEVIGTLSSFNGITMVVTGPSGQVTATLAADFELKGDLSPGTAVKMEGSVEADGSMVTREAESACAGVGFIGVGFIDCPAGVDTQFELEIEGDKFEVTGTLVSLNDVMVLVLGPGLEVEAAVDAGTEVEDDPQPGDAVKVQGDVLADGSLRARQIVLVCEPVAPMVQPPAEVPPAEMPLAEVPPVAQVCNRGPGQAGEFRLEIDDGEVEIKRGTVVSFADGVLIIDTPIGPLTVIIDGAEMDGDLTLAEEVRLEGELQADGRVLAEEVKVLCPNRDEDDDNDDDD